MKICHNCGRELENSVKNCIRCNEEQYDDAVIFKTSPKPPPEVKIRKATQPNTPQVPSTQQAPAAPMGATQPSATPFPQAPAAPTGATQPSATPFPQAPAAPTGATQPNTPQVPSTQPAPAAPMGATQPSATPFPQAPAEPMGAAQELAIATPASMLNEQTPPIGVDTTATIAPEILDEIIASETNIEEDEKTKTNSLSVLILLILIFVIVLIILRPILIDALVPSSPSIGTSVQIPQVQPQATPEVTPDATPQDSEAPEVSSSLAEEFPHIEYLGKTIEELDFDVSLQNENTYGFTDDGVSILFEVDDTNSITNVQYKSNYVVNSSDIEGIEKNIATITEICNMFGVQNSLELYDTNALSLSDLTSSSFIEAGIETATYKAVFLQEDTKATITVDYSLVAGLYSVVQLIDFSSDNDIDTSEATETTETSETTETTTDDTEVSDETTDIPITNSSISDSPETGVAIEGNLRGV